VQCGKGFHSSCAMLSLFYPVVLFTLPFKQDDAPEQDQKEGQKRDGFAHRLQCFTFDSSQLPCDEDVASAHSDTLRNCGEEHIATQKYALVEE
jgi:hypothetical protein